MDTKQIGQSIEKAKERFTKVPNNILFNGHISDAELRTFIVLKSYKIGNNKVFPSLATLASMRKKSKKSISNHIRRLKDLEIIFVKRRGFSKSNIYSFEAEPGSQESTAIKEENYVSLETKTSPLIGNKLPPKYIKSNKNEINKGEISENEGIAKCRNTLKELGLKR